MTDQSNSFIESAWIAKDKSFEITLRPEKLNDFIGQEKILKQLHILIGAAKKRNEAVCHCLFCGPPGLGKTTLANIVSKTMGTNLITTSGPVLEKPGDLAGILTNLQDGDILFIDEIHRLPKSVEEYLYPAMEDFNLDLLIDAGPNARSVQVKLNRFTLIGATTRSGLISSPMRSRFNFNARLDYYNANDLKQIIVRSSKILNIGLDDESSYLIAERARGTPRIANNLLKWARDYAQMHQVTTIDKKTALDALNLLSIDHLGLDDMDKKLLSVIIDHYDGGPVGVQTIAVAIGEETSTIAEVYEPYLIMKGLLKRTPRGREATNLAYEHMGKKSPQK
jgi:Holliday junction DNA helicase RuvB